jgi:hypothetical protein
MSLDHFHNPQPSTVGDMRHIGDHLPSPAKVMRLLLQPLSYLAYCFALILPPCFTKDKGDGKLISFYIVLRLTVRMC